MQPISNESKYELEREDIMETGLLASTKRLSCVPYRSSSMKSNNKPNLGSCLFPKMCRVKPVLNFVMPLGLVTTNTGAIAPTVRFIWSSVNALYPLPAVRQNKPTGQT